MASLQDSNLDSSAYVDTNIDSIVGISDWAVRVRQDILSVASHSSNVLITGPNGTGKEVVARAIHDHSPRHDKPLIPVDCAAFVSSLFPSHLFGHVKGAFTGAEHETMGCFRAANGGTIFLDEIGELELTLQAKLLRVLQERVVVPVGGVEGVPIDVRIIAATNRDLKAEVDAGRFREDLYYRLNVVWFQTLGLEQRPDDLEVLASHFLGLLACENGLPLKQLSSQAARLLRGYHWPGNLRQLKNVLERAVIYSSGEIIERNDVLPILRTERGATLEAPKSLDSAPSPTADLVLTDAEDALLPEDDSTAWLKLEDLERHHIEQTLEQTFYNQTAAAELLGITPRVLAGKIKKFGISLAQSRRGRPRKDRSRRSR